MSIDRKDRGKPLPVTPEASNNDLADWVERLFDGEFPSKLHVIELHGRSGILTRGDVHDHQDFKPNQERPKKEYFISLSNRFLAAAQRDCDMRRKPQNYVVEAFNVAKSSEAYSRFPLSLAPRTLYLKSINGKGATVDDEEDDENADKFGGDRLLRRVDRLFIDAKHNVEMTYAAMGQMFVLYQQTNERLQEQNDKLMTRWMEATEAKEKALSGQADRDLARTKQQFWLDQMKDGAHLVKGLLPPLVNGIVGKDVVPVTGTTEGMVLRNFINSCSEHQIEAAFGKWDDSPEPKLITEGVFTPRQAYILNSIADGKIDANYIDNLIEGEDRITPEQLARVQQENIFTQNQLIPIQNLIMMRVKKLAARKKE